MSQDVMGSILVVLSATLNTALFSDDPRSQSGPLSWESVSELWHIAMQGETRQWTLATDHKSKFSYN